MLDRLTIALAQVNPMVGDLDGNCAILRDMRARAGRAGADLVVFSELVVSGYPPEDLVLKPAFQNDVEDNVRALAGETGDGGPGMIVGCPWHQDGRLYNAVLLLDGGEIAGVRLKHELPNYGVFDEKRVFAPGPLPGPVDFRGLRLGLMICEDMWSPEVAECLHETGAEMLIVINGSPFETDKRAKRLNLAVARVVESGLPLIYVNQVGGQDELVFDGVSFALNGDRSLAVQMPPWREDLALAAWRRDRTVGWQCQGGPVVATDGAEESVYRALMVGLADYTGKNRFPGVIVGLSGGVDSALCAAVAVDAIGPEHVRCVMMPSRYTSAASLRDASDCAARLSIRLDRLSIEPMVGAFSDGLAEVMGGGSLDVTAENIQARTRGIILMALSNRFGDMVLTTGNKSEMSVGYATLYGDMCGGYSILKDVYKTAVYRLAAWRNAHRPDGALGPDGMVIPENILTKPASAELRPDQTDQDSLPPYDVLDDILECFIERDMASADVVARGHAAQTVARIEHMLYTAEYKRRQAPPGVKITSRQFGRDRRYPITNGYRNARRTGVSEWASGDKSE